MRPFLLGSLVLLSLTLSAATPVAPVAPVYGGQINPDVDPSAATNGSTTLVAWTNTFSVYAETWSVCARLVGVQSESFCLGAGLHPQAASNGNDYLIVRSVAASRFNTYAYDNVVADVIHADGSRGATRGLNHSLGGGVPAAAWNGREWIVAIVSEGVGRVVFLDENLTETRSAKLLGAASNIQLFERDGAWWAVRVQESQSEAVAIDGDARFTVDGQATIAGSIAFIANGSTIRITTFDPQRGFGEPHAGFTDSHLIDAQELGSGARVVLQSGPQVRAALIDAAGSVTQSATLYEDLGGASAALLNDTLYFATPVANRDIRATPFAIAPIDIASSTLVSVTDLLVQAQPLMASNGEHAFVLWTQFNGTTDETSTFVREVDSTGTPLGEAHALPYSVRTTESDAVVRGDTLIVVWSDGSHVHAGIGDDDILLGEGTKPAIATSAQGTFVVWLGSDGLVHGTPLEGRVPGGFTILSSFSGQSAPAITAIEDGFLVLWTTNELQSIVISPAGAVRSATALGEATAPVVAGRLAALSGTLFAYGPDARPFERFDPHWGWNWTPVSIERLDENRYRVFIKRNGGVYASAVTMEGAFITGITPLDFIGYFSDVRKTSVATLGGKPAVVSTRAKRVELTISAPAKARPVRRAR